MNRTTLQERIKEEIVLRRGQVKERQWRQTGLPDEAAREGILPDEFRRLVNEVSRQISFDKLTDLHRRMEDALQAPPMYQLHQTQEDDFVAEGERMGLSASFVEDRWIPQLIADFKKENTATLPTEPPHRPVPTEIVPTPVVSTPTESPNRPVPPPPVIEPLNRPLREQVKTILDEYQGHISARDLRLLFRAMPADERVLAEEILAYFSANFYASETEPQGATLPEKLLSTDWRHVAWWDKPTVNEPIAAAEPTPVYTPPAPEPALPYVAPPTPRPQSSNAGLWGAVFAVVVLLILYFLIKPNQKKLGENQDENRPAPTEQTQPDRRTAPRSADSEKAPKPQREESVAETSQDNKSDEDVATEKRSPESNRIAGSPAAKPKLAEESTTVEEPQKPAQKYDRLLETTGQFGEQPAKLGRKWGLWRNGDWMVYPIYDDITTFREGRATVVRNGRTYDIDEKGSPLVE